MRAGHGLYFGRVVPLIGGALSDREAYRYLPRSLAYLPPPTQLVELMRTSGFDDLERCSLSGGAAQLLTGTRT
jgi:demethylmenaquinone methyltransferase/2-methoxy-6-polyprenyl-1,4-benzoquinol methylase